MNFSFPDIGNVLHRVYRYHCVLSPYLNNTIQSLFQCATHALLDNFAANSPNNDFMANMVSSHAANNFTPTSTNDRGRGGSSPEPIHDNNSHPYALHIYFIGNRQNGWDGTPWWAVVELQCRNLPQLMREGLHWDPITNIVPEMGYGGSTAKGDRGPWMDKVNPRLTAYTRVWTTRAMSAPAAEADTGPATGRPAASGCPWEGTITLFAGSVDALADVDLGSRLSRRRIWGAAGVKFGVLGGVSGSGAGSDPVSVFLYNCPRATEESRPELGNINYVYDHLHPRHGSWWFWLNSRDEELVGREEGGEGGPPSYDEVQDRK